MGVAGELVVARRRRCAPASPDASRLDPDGGWTTAPPAKEVFDANAGVAAQAQFYVRRAL